MSDNLVLDVKSLLDSNSLGLGTALSFIPAGAVVEGATISKLKLDPTHKTRVAFLTDGGFGYQQHYLKGFGAVLCNQGDCCKYMTSNPAVETSKRLLFPVLVYNGLVDPVRATVNDIQQKNLSLAVLSVHYGTYNKRMADSFANGDIMLRDWILTPTTGQFAGGVEAMAGSTACLYAQIPELKKWVFDTLNAHSRELFDDVGIRFNLEKYRAFLNGGGQPGGNVQPSAPAVPTAPVDLKALEGNFSM